MLRTMVVVSLVVVGCSPVSTPDAGPRLGCVDDRECTPNELFYCNTVEEKCTPKCATSADCQARPAEFALAECAGPLGCNCDQGTCVRALCSTDAACGAGEACRNGVCVAAPTAALVHRCSISPDVVVTRSGARIHFAVLAWDSSGAPVVVPSGASWRALGTSLSGAGAGNSQTFTAGPSTGAAAPEAAVEASFGAVRCEARALVVPEAAAGELAVSVFDARNGRPIDGAKVLLTTAAGEVIAQSAGDTVATDGRGFATPALAADVGVFTLSVFHADYTYVTYAHVEGSARTFSIALERNPAERAGGFKGTLTDVPLTSNLKLGRVGLSPVGELSGIDPLAPPLRTTPTDVRIGSAFEQLGAPLDAAEFLGNGKEAIKSHLSATGQSGTCADEGRVLAGACATRTAWSIAGDLRITDYPIDLIVQWEPLDARPLFTTRFAGFRDFSSSVVRDFEFPLAPTPRTDAGVPDLSGEAQLAELTLPFTQMPFAFQFEAPLPRSPELSGLVAGIGAVVVPGRGLVPLGLGVARDAERGPVNFRMAPGHHGLEGLPYLAFVERVSHFDPLDGRVGTALVGRTESLPFDLTGQHPVSLDAQTFLPLPRDVQVDFAARTLTVPGIAGATAVRVRFTDGQLTRWDVTVAPTAATVTLPQPPGALRDRLFVRGNARQGARSAIAVEAQRTGLGGTVEGFTRWLTRDDTQADRAFDRLAAFSFFERPAPGIAFVAPSTIARGGGVRLEWVGFSPPRDGHALVSFAGGTGCTSALVDGTELRLPQSCTGDAVTITAELVLPDGVTALTPPVATSVTVPLR